MALVCGVVAGAILWMPSTPPETPHKRIELALSSLKSGDLTTFSKIRRSFQNDSQSKEYESLFEGLVALKQGEWEVADQKLESIDPNSDLRSFSLLARAEALYRMGRLSDAERVLRQMLREESQNLDAHRLLGAIYYDLGSYDLALEHLESVVEQDPDSLGSHHLMGIMYQDFKRENEASEHFQAALALNPPEAIRQKLLLALTQSLIAIKEYSKALDLAKSATPSQRSFALQARCLWNLDRKKEARTIIQNAPTNGSPDRFLCLMELQILQTDRNWEQAVEIATAFLEHDPYDTEIRYQLAQSYARLNRQVDYEREISRFQRHIEFENQLTELNHQAIQNPRDPIVRDQLAEVCDSLGKQELAEMWREAAQNCREGQALYSGNQTKAIQPSVP